MLAAGLVSITFRNMSPGEIVQRMVASEVEAVEWGGDVHVPHGNVERATQVAALTANAGLRVSAYGSYYRVGHDEELPFEEVLGSAVALKAPLIRVWAGRKASGEADAEYRDAVTEDARRIADMAAAAGIGVAFEFHGGTLTDTNASALRLLRDIEHANVGTYWQPPVGASEEECIQGIASLSPWLRNIHAFSWEGGGRLPLASGAERWRKYLRTAAEAPGDHDVLLEFVSGDSPASFIEDAATLRSWIREADE